MSLAAPLLLAATAPSTWTHRADRAWRWTLDHGTDLATSRARPRVRHAACTGEAAPVPRPMFRCAPQADGQGGSPDGTLACSCGGGNRAPMAWLWSGRDRDMVIDDRVRLDG